MDGINGIKDKSVLSEAEGTAPDSMPSGAELELIERIEATGPITFADFMETALYAASGGYYTSKDGRWGTGADYVTSIDISSAFARTLAGQVYEMWQLLSCPDTFSLIEAGAGRGWLGTGILDTVEERYPDFFSVLTLRLVDRSFGTLEETEHGRVERVSGLELLEPAPFGVIISNELIDSFPVHRLLFEGGLKEVFVDYRDGLFIEVFQEPSTAELAGYLAPFEFVEGQRVEVNLNAAKWLKSAASCIGAGFIITIDYGLPARELYALGRPSTLLCHLRHTINDNPYTNVGLQDITTHVDFTGMVEAGRENGLELTGFTTQKNFLIGAGVLEELMQVTGDETDEVERVSHNRSIQELIMPGGMGDTFKVLVQHKGVERQELKGFEFKEMSKYL